MVLGRKKGRDISRHAGPKKQVPVGWRGLAPLPSARLTTGIADESVSW